MDGIASAAISAVPKVGGQLGADLFSNNDTAGAAGGPDFAQTLQSAFDTLNAQQNKAMEMSKDFATDKNGDIHSVMIASEQATISLQMATQIRNKVVDAYQEVMRISM